MSATLDHVPGGFVEFDDDGTITAANATLAGWLGYPAAGLAGLKMASLLTVANRIFFQTHFFPLLLLQGQAEEIFLNLLGRDGSALPVVAGAVRDVSGPVPRNRCLLLTVRQRRKYEDEILRAKETAEDAVRRNTALGAAQQELERHATELERRVREVESRNEELQRVSEILSHDLREPIRKIGLFADMLRGQLGPAPRADAAAALAKIQREAGQMEELVGALRQFLDATPTSRAEVVPMKALVEQAAAEVTARHAFTDWTIECQPLADVVGHPALLRLLFVHLLENAVKFRDRGRRLRVEVRGRVVQENIYEATRDRFRYVDFLQLEIADNGAGFDPKYREYIFRLLKKVRLESPGFGVGLATCRKIAAAHFGSISAENAAEGATFIVRLPLGFDAPPTNPAAPA